jgi:hypothetical protein
MFQVHLAINLQNVCTLYRRECNVGADDDEEDADAPTAVAPTPFANSTTEHLPSCRALSSPQTNENNAGGCRCYFGVAAFHDGVDFSVNADC